MLCEVANSCSFAVARRLEIWDFYIRGSNQRISVPPGALRPNLIADIYAAALDEAEWPRFSTLVGKAAGIEAVSVWLTEKSNIIEASMAPMYASLLGPYREHFGKLDPWAAGLGRHPTEKVMLAYEHIREDDLQKTEFYHDFARPGGMFRPIGVKMRLAPDVYATMGSDNPFAKKLFGESDKSRVQQVLPHVKRALQLRRRQHQSIPAASTQASALNAFAFGVIICDNACRAVFVNGTAEDYAHQKMGITLGTSARAVSALLANETRTLTRLIHDAATGGAGGLLRVTGQDGTAVLIVLVTPLPRPLDRHYGPGHALVSLRSMRDRPAFAEASLGALFGLSPTQAAIALALHAGKSPEQIATERGVQISTIRTHLAEIFARTAAENQRDLVRLIGLLPPIR
jgi:DNA-binding CsgD family transcriptional regulator